MRRARLKVAPNLSSLSRGSTKIQDESETPTTDSAPDIQTEKPVVESAADVRGPGTTDSGAASGAENRDVVPSCDLEKEESPKYPERPNGPFCSSGQQIEVESTSVKVALSTTPASLSQREGVEEKSMREKVTSSSPEKPLPPPSQIDQNQPKNKSSLLQKSFSRLKVKPNVKASSRPAPSPAEAKVPDLTLVESTEFTLKDGSITIESKANCTDKKSEAGEILENNFSTCESGQKSKQPLEEVSTRTGGTESPSKDRLVESSVGQSEKEVHQTTANTDEHREVGQGTSLNRFKPRVNNKIRPNIEGASHRIRTYSSASESEDEGKRLQTRTGPPAAKKPSASIGPKPVRQTEVEIIRKDDGKSKKKPEEKSQLECRKRDMRKKFAKGQVDLSQMTMFDLIYYNPDGEKPARSKEKIVTRRRLLETETPAKETDVNPILEERLAEEEEERQLIEAVEAAETAETGDAADEGKENQNEEEEEEEGDSAMPVPQVRLGPNGEIILDEQSLVIETSETKKRKSELANAPVIIENSAGLVNYGSWSKRKRSTKWSVRETARFYRALSMLGTDFSLMESLFPRRTRFELKRKFKTEEKVNRALIDKTIETQKPFDASVFGEESDQSENESVTSKAEPKKQTKKKAGKSSSSQESRTGRKKRKKSAKTVSDDEDLVDPETQPSPMDSQVEGAQDSQESFMSTDV